MNAEEAKVPDVDGDWQSIEIYLFSNGQQYSPPRKYFLAADDLNSWEATLNQLAQSHYGLQSPLIDLYTTDGQLVEGPLELKDGQAYVAVTPPDTFIDAGYQKYLLKASRSWEKRQARKRVPECVPGEPCCLCPEKDWCCDLQKCCLCAEKDFPEPLLCATGHPELRPAGGHFMSSAPVKLDDYGPRSGKIGATVGKHEVGLGEYETNPDKYKYSSIQVQAKPDEFGVSPGEHETEFNENGPRWSKNGVKPVEHDITLSESGMSPGENGQNEPWSSEDEAREPGSVNYIVKRELREIVETLNDKKDWLDEKPRDTDVGKKCHYTCKFREHSSILNLLEESRFDKKGEYTVKESYPKDKEIEPNEIGRTDCVIGVSGGKESSKEIDTGTGICRPAKIENARKLNEHRTAEIDHKRRLSELKREQIEKRERTSEPTREFEFGGKVSEQSGEKINPTGKVMGQVAAKNGARLSEQRNSGHVARSGGHESKVDNHDTGLGNSSSGVSEPIAKAMVSGSKSNPRERFISKVKKMGQTKLAIPNTIVDEAAPRLVETDIKNKGTGAANASYLTETQQHTRRNSLSAGRPSSEKKHLPSGQNSSLLKKPTLTSSIPRKSEDKKPTKTDKEAPQKKMSGNSSTIPVLSSSEKSKTTSRVPYKRVTPPGLPAPTISFTKIVTKQEIKAMDKGPPENVIDENQITVTTTLSLNNQESELRSLVLGSDKDVDAIKSSSRATQTEPNVEKSMPSSVSEGVQTDTIAVEPHEKHVCSQQDYRIATLDPDENTISIINKGDIINLKLNIEVRNIVRSVHSSQKNSPKSRSLTNITRSEKESQISIDDDTFVQNNALQDVVNDQHFQGYGFEGSPKVMIVQCAGCGPLNNRPRLEPPQCCDNEKQYLVMLTNSAHADNTNDDSNCNTLCRPSNQKHSQPRKPGCGGNPTNNTFSEITLDTITTVTVSGGPLMKQTMEKCLTKNSSSRTEEPQNECVASKRRVSITKDSSTKGSFQKQNVSSLSITAYIENVPNCMKTCKYEEMQECSVLCSPVYPQTCQIVKSVNSKATLKTSLQIQSKGCQPICPKVQSQGSSPPPPCPSCFPETTSIPMCPQGCTPLSPPKCPPCCPKPPPILTCPQECSPPPPKNPSCCPKTPSTPMCLQEPTPLPPPTCPQCYPKPPPILTCPQECTPVTPPKCCPKAPPIPKLPQVCNLPPPTCAPCCPISSPTPVCPQVCTVPPPTCPSCCSPLPCIHIQTQVCPPGIIPDVADSQTQTQWAHMVLQARRHYDGRYSFHLPPLSYLNNNPS